LAQLAEAEGGSVAFERLEQLQVKIDQDDPTDPGEIAEIKRSRWRSSLERLR
jgi:hypothetical protein